MDEADPIGERVAVIETQIEELRRDFETEKLDRALDHKRLSALELGMAKDVAEIKVSLTAMAKAQESMAKDWREAYGDKRENKGSVVVIRAVVVALLGMFGGFVGKAVWDAVFPPDEPVIARPKHSDATPYASHCAPGAPYPCEPSR